MIAQFVHNLYQLDPLPLILLVIPSVQAEPKAIGNGLLRDVLVVQLLLGHIKVESTVTHLSRESG